MSACRKENKLRFVLLLKTASSVLLPDAVHVFGSVNHLASITKDSL